MGKKIGLGLLVVVLVLLAVISLQPSSFKINRSTTIAAPPEVVYGLVSDFHNWAAWSPWDKMDPNMKRTYSGAASGQGAIYEWVGNDQVGQGRMTITRVKPNQEVEIRLEFIKPFAATNVTRFDLAGDKETKFTWSMEGANGFVMKAVGLFMNMDKQVGNDFEKGLAQLKPLAEKAAADKVAAEKAAAEKAAAEKAAAEKAEAEKLEAENAAKNTPTPPKK